jgi:hypothetical protein
MLIRIVSFFKGISSGTPEVIRAYFKSWNDYWKLSFDDFVFLVKMLINQNPDEVLGHTYKERLRLFRAALFVINLSYIYNMIFVDYSSIGCVLLTVVYLCIALPFSMLTTKLDECIELRQSTTRENPDWLQNRNPK